MNAECIDTDGSYNCTCNTGYEGDGNNCSSVFSKMSAYNCISFQLFALLSDVDECQRGTDTCSDNAQCIDLDGSYNCMCIIGFEGDGFFNCTSKQNYITSLYGE